MRQHCLATIVVSVAILALAGCSAASSPSPSPVPSVDAQAEIATTSSLLDEALSKYRGGDASSAEQLVGDAYLEHFELVEKLLEEKDPELTEKIEELIATEIRNAMKEGRPVDEVAALVAEAKANLDRASAVLR
jgi:hypothetical protein